jgi:hypothetical protein
LNYDIVIVDQIVSSLTPLATQKKTTENTPCKKTHLLLHKSATCTIRTKTRAAREARTKLLSPPYAAADKSEKCSSNADDDAAEISNPSNLFEDETSPRKKTRNTPGGGGVKSELVTASAGDLQRGQPPAISAI